VKLGRIFTFTEYLNATLDPSVEEVESAMERGRVDITLGRAFAGSSRSSRLTSGPLAGLRNPLWRGGASDVLFENFWNYHARKMLPFFFHANIAQPTWFQPLYLVPQENARYDRPPIGGVYSRRGLSLAVESALAETP